MVAAENFGCGSSREYAARAIKEAGFDVGVGSFLPLNGFDDIDYMLNNKPEIENFEN